MAANDSSVSVDYVNDQYARLMRKGETVAGVHDESSFDNGEALLRVMKNRQYGKEKT